MESDAAIIGLILGFIANIVMQFFVWRYLFVYYSLSGQKIKYEQRKVAYNFLFILLGMLTYPILWGFGTLFWPIAVVILVAFVYYAFTLHSKWKVYAVLPDPFSSSTKSSKGSPVIGHPNSNPQSTTVASVSEDAFFAVLQLEGVTKARSIYLQAIQQAPNEMVFQESRLNKLAYEELRKGKFDLAIDLFALNIEAFPYSANNYASLADAYKAKGDTEKATTNYKKALELLVIDHSKTEQYRQSLLVNIKDNLSKLNAG